MADYHPGDFIVYSDRDRNDLKVAQVDLVGPRHLSSFLWRSDARVFARGRTRIMRDRIERRLPPGADVTQLINQLEALQQTRNARRRAANEWFRESVKQIARELEREDA